MSSPTKVRANRRNSLASTGPKTAAGKAIVAANPIKHGLLSSMPLVTTFESQEAWDAHLNGTLADLHPEGHVETALVERIALLLWRLGRVTRFEVEAINTRIEDAETLWARQLNQHTPYADSPLPKLKAAVAKLEGEVVVLEGVLTADPETVIDPDSAMQAVKRGVKNADVDVEKLIIAGYPAGAELWEVDWTAALTRNAIEAIAKARGWTLEEILGGLTWDAKNDLSEKRKELRTKKADLARFRRCMLIADESTTERVRKYETGLERAMLRCLHELDRLQSARRGTITGVGVKVSHNGSSAEAVALIGRNPGPALPGEDNSHE